MKKLALYTILTSGLLATGLSFASAAPVMPMPTFTGFFVGADFGFRALQVQEFSTTDISGGVFGSEDSSFTNNFTETQPTEGLNIGYGYEFSNQVYLGAKLFGQIAQGSETASETNSDPDGTTRTTRTPQRFGSLYGINGQLGYALTPHFLPYLTAGAEWLNIQYADTALAYGIVDAPGVSVSESSGDSSINKYTPGWDAGVGMKFMITDHWLINTEFTGAWFSSQSSAASYVRPDDAVINRSLKVTPNVFTGLVGMSYLFDF